MTDEPKTSEQPSGHLRWVTPPRTTTEPPRLQQLYYITTYRGLDVEQKEEWRDVPLVVE